MLVFGALFVLISLVDSAVVVEWPKVLLIMGSVAVVILAMNFWASFGSTGWREILKMYYIVPLVPLYFKASEYISTPIHGHNFDAFLVQVDRFICGGWDPTVWLFTHFPHPPALTEYLTLCYSVFYFLPVALSVELYRQAQREESNGFSSEATWAKFQQLFFIIIYGFLISFASYVILPSIGPRFSVHNFFDLSKDLPGVLVTEPIRTFLNLGENIRPSMNLAEVTRCVTRDAFPSGHTDMTLITMILAFRFRAKLRWVLLVVGSSLIFSTVYLRYHYVVDLIGGAMLAAITFLTWRFVRDWMVRINSRFA